MDSRVKHGNDRGLRMRMTGCCEWNGKLLGNQGGGDFFGAVKVD